VKSEQEQTRQRRATRTAGTPLGTDTNDAEKYLRMSKLKNMVQLKARPVVRLGFYRFFRQLLSESGQVVRPATVAGA